MPLISILITLVFVGIVLWLINAYIPMAQPIKMILNAVVVLFVLIWLLRIFGAFGPLATPVRLSQSVLEKLDPILSINHVMPKLVLV